MSQEKATQARYTDSGIRIEPVYSAWNDSRTLPGEFPYTRGVRRDMYLGRLWTMRQYAGFSTAEASNERYHYLLEQGTMGLSVAFDLPTQIGFDSDHPYAEGEVGKVGVSICSLRDMEVLFKGIRLEDITTSMTINATASILLCMYIALAKKQGADLSKISGTIQNDILKEYAARGTYIYPVGPSMRLITDIFEYCSRELPKWNTISISGYHIREAGSTAAQELAFTLANGKAYVEAALSRGLDSNVFGKRLSFFFNAHNNFFEEVAKFRAARKIWAEYMQAAGATDPQAMMLRFHTQTGGSTLTAQQPENNIVRVSLQALAAVLGGTQSLHTNGYDEALSLPTEKAAGIALRTQQIIAFESGVTDTADPLAGSYFVENLTDAIEKEALRLMQVIDDMGGAAKSIESGWMQQQIADAAYRYQQAVERGEKKIVGVNSFRTEANTDTPVFRIDDSIRLSQTARLEQLRSERNAQKAEQALHNVEECAKGTGNLIPHILEAVENDCTLGEIADAMRKVFGLYNG
jgi:methylmalonyl-CoA mutase N-terminal domain/subunit